MKPKKKDTLKLPLKPTLPDFQRYIRKMVRERGFVEGNVGQKFLLLMEECGEFAKAARKASGLHIDTASVMHDLGHEAADVFMYVLDICNQFGIDLESAFREKEEINKKRTWTKRKAK